MRIRSVLFCCLLGILGGKALPTDYEDLAEDLETAQRGLGIDELFTQIEQLQDFDSATRQQIDQQWNDIDSWNETEFVPFKENESELGAEFAEIYQSIKEYKQYVEGVMSETKENYELFAQTAQIQNASIISTNTSLSEFKNGVFENLNKRNNEVVATVTSSERNWQEDTEERTARAQRLLNQVKSHIANLTNSYDAFEDTLVTLSRDLRDNVTAFHARFTALDTRIVELYQHLASNKTVVMNNQTLINNKQLQLIGDFGTFRTSVLNAVQGYEALLETLDGLIDDVAARIEDVDNDVTAFNASMISGVEDFQANIDLVNYTITKEYIGATQVVIDQTKEVFTGNVTQIVADLSAGFEEYIDELYVNTTVLANDIDDFGIYLDNQLQEVRNLLQEKFTSVVELSGVVKSEYSANKVNLEALRDTRYASVQNAVGPKITILRNQMANIEILLQNYRAVLARYNTLQANYTSKIGGAQTTFVNRKTAVQTGINQAESMLESNPEYLDSLLATQRDDVLAELGKTLTTLNSTMTNTRQVLSDTEKAIEAMNYLKALIDGAGETLATNWAHVATLDESFNDRRPKLINMTQVIEDTYDSIVNAQVFLADVRQKGDNFNATLQATYENLTASLQTVSDTINNFKTNFDETVKPETQAKITGELVHAQEVPPLQKTLSNLITSKSATLVPATGGIPIGAPNHVAFGPKLINGLTTDFTAGRLTFFLPARRTVLITISGYLSVDSPNSIPKDGCVLGMFINNTEPVNRLNAWNACPTCRSYTGQSNSAGIVHMTTLPYGTHTITVAARRMSIFAQSFFQMAAIPSFRYPPPAGSCTTAGTISVMSFNAIPKA